MRYAGLLKVADALDTTRRRAGMVGGGIGAVSGANIGSAQGGRLARVLFPRGVRYDAIMGVRTGQPHRAFRTTNRVTTAAALLLAALGFFGGRMAGRGLVAQRKPSWTEKLRDRMFKGDAS